MPKDLYDLSTGFNEANLVNLKIDTFERMNRIQEGLKIPAYKTTPIPSIEFKPFIPKEYNADTLIKGNVKLPTLNEALDSADPYVEQAAREQMKYLASKNPVSYGAGIDQYVKYTPGQNKFTNDNIFKGKRNTMYGYNPYISMAENEDFNHENVWNSYSMMGKAWRGTAMFAGRAISKAVTGIVGMVGDLGSIAWNGLQELGDLANINNGTKNNFWEDVSNNALSREMEKWDQHVKDQWLPTYKALNYDKKGAFNKLFDAYTWTNSFADGAGFLLQFIAPGMIFSKLAMAGKLSRGIGALEEVGQVAAAEELAAGAGKTIAQAKNINGFTRAMGYELPGKVGKISEALTGSDNLGGISAHIFNTVLESVAETKGGFDQTVQELMNKGLSREDAVKEASQNAPSQFWANMGILTLSNAFENKFLQKAVGNRVIPVKDELTLGTTLRTTEEATTKFGKVLQKVGKSTWGNRITFYGGNAAKATFWEGLWEENAQNAAGRWARGEYDRSDQKGETHEKASKYFFDQLLRQTKDALKGNDIENADSIMAGAVIGILGTGVFSKMAGKREAIYEQEVRDKDGNLLQKAKLIKPRTFLPEGERRMKMRDNADRVSTFINTRDAWLSINTFAPDMYEKDADGKIVLNKEKVQQKVEEIKEKVAKINAITASTITTDTIVDPIERDDLQRRIFASYVKAHILNETGDSLVKRLKQWGNKSKDELELYGVTEEAARNSHMWATRAENLVEVYKKANEILYAAPSDTKLEAYQNNINAIRSLVYDYTSLRDSAKDVVSTYDEILDQDENNPFKDNVLLRTYNEDQVKLIKLKAKLEKSENLSFIERDIIQKRIDELEKVQKDRKKDQLDAFNDTKENSQGIILPKTEDTEEYKEKISKAQDYFDVLSLKIDNEIKAETYDELTKKYSNPKTAYSDYLKTIEYWDGINNNPIDTELENEVINDFKKQKDTLQKEISDLQDSLQTATTQEERDKIEKEIVDKKTEVDKLEEEILAAKAKAEEEAKKTKTETPKEDEDLEIDDEPPTPVEKVYGVTDYANQSLAYKTPFKTVNKETIDFLDENKEKVWWKEYALEHGYDHALSIFARYFQNEITKFPDKYEVFVIKDTVELMKERLSEKQMKEYEEGKFKRELGAIVVFREKGKTEYLKFKDGKTVIFSYNEEAFNYDYDERVRINAEKTKRTPAEVIKFFQQEQAIADAIREKVISENAVIPIKADLGSLGVLPVTNEAGNVFERFSEFRDADNPIIIIKTDNKNLVRDSSEGQVYFQIPAIKTVNGKDHFIGVYASNIQKGEDKSLQSEIYNSIQAIQYSTFKHNNTVEDKKRAKKEAYDIIKNYLFNFFYVTETNKFQIVEVQDGFKIVYSNQDGQHINWLNIPRLKVSDNLYNSEEGFSLYEKVDGVFSPTKKITKDQYRQFIHNHLVTKRKAVVQKSQGVYKLYTDPVNAYLNLSAINTIDVSTNQASQTTEDLIIVPMVDQRSQESQDDRVKQSQKADIEKRRQEELAKGKRKFRERGSDSVNLGRDTFEQELKRAIASRKEQGLSIDEEFIKSQIEEVIFISQYNHPTVASINAKYDAEYVDAVKKGEMTKEQAMQALEEIGRKESSAYAELAALENTKPVSDKEADIEEDKFNREFSQIIDQLNNFFTNTLGLSIKFDGSGRRKLDNGKEVVTYEITIYQNGKAIGNTGFKIVNGKIEISLTEINEKLQGKGVASVLYQDINNALQQLGYGVLHSDTTFLEDSRKQETFLIVDGKELSLDETSEFLLSLEDPLEDLEKLKEEGRVQEIKKIKPGEKLWQSLERKGLAEKLENGQYRFINAKYDAELAALETKNQEPVIKTEDDETVVPLQSAQEANPMDELNLQLKLLKDKLVNTKSPLVIKALKARIEVLERQLALENKPEEKKTTMEKIEESINEIVTESTLTPSTAIVVQNFEGNSYKIDFDNDVVEGVFPDTGKEFAEDFMNSFISSVFTKNKIEINGIDYYFVKHNKLGKFVTFDENMKFYKVSELPQSVKDSNEFKNIENCK